MKNDKIKNLANKIHSINHMKTLYEEFLYDEIIKIFNGDDDNSKSWPCEDLHTDFYDNSLELISCLKSTKPTEEQQSQIWKMGFSKLYVNYKDGSEKLYSTSKNSCFDSVITDFREDF